MAASSGPPFNSLPQPSTAQLKIPPSKYPPPCLCVQPSDGGASRSRPIPPAIASSGPLLGPSPSQIGPQDAAGDRSERARSGQKSVIAAASGASAAFPLPKSSSQAVAGSSTTATLASRGAGAHTSSIPSVSVATAGRRPHDAVPGSESVLAPSGPQAGASVAKLSYASIVRVPSGPSFIRDHSIAVAAFGALPDIVAQPRISSIGGSPSVNFSPEELQAAENIFLDAIVMKFISGRPSWEICYSTINSWGLQQEFIMGPLDSKSVLLRFRDQRDMIAVLARGSHYINGFPYRAFRWNRQYNVKEEAAFAPVWVSFPRLPIPFFVPSMLKGIANSIGNFLCFDRSTTLMTRASSARVCIEVDLTKNLPEHVWIGVHGKFQQPIIYEKLPKFCDFCKVQGHNDVECKKTSMDKSNPSTHGAFDPLAHYGEEEPLPSNTDSLKDVSLSSELQPSQLACPRAPMAQEGIASKPVLVETAMGPEVIQFVAPSELLASSVSSFLTGKSLDKHKSGYFSVGSNVCTTDFSNQRPPSSSTDLLQPAVQTCTPAVCSNAEAKGPVESDGNAELIPHSSFSPVLALQPGRAKFQADQPPVSPAAQSHAAPESCTPGACPNDDEIILATASFQEVPGLSTIVTPAAPRPIQVVSQDLCTFEEPRRTSATHRDSALRHKQVEGPMLTPKQSAALDRFKKKVNFQAKIVGDYSTNPFDALQRDSDDDDCSVYVASYNSDTDDELEEPLNMGYLSADGHSLSNNKKPSCVSSGRKINTRHPNVPLNAKLRSRKSLSIPIRLCL